MEHLIPDSWFEVLASGWLWIVLIGAFVVLVKGADWVVDGASNLASHLGVGQVIIGATVVSLGTTTPEAAVSVMAAWSGNPGLALGNAIGSVICDTALVFGFICVLARVPVVRFVLDRQGWAQFASGVLLFVVCLIARAFSPEIPVIGRAVGYGFLALLILYFYVSIHWARQHSVQIALKKAERETSHGSERETEETIHPVKCSILLLVGLILVLFASRFLIGAVSELALRWDVPKEVVAATLVAFGTSVPEFFTAISALKKGHLDLMVGNIVGADILNVLFVVGASAAAAPLIVPEVFFNFHLPVMVGVLFLFRIFISMSKTHFSRWMGIPLLGIYLAYVVLQYKN